MSCAAMATAAPCLCHHDSLRTGTVTTAATPARPRNIHPVAAFSSLRWNSRGGSASSPTRFRTRLSQPSHGRATAVRGRSPSSPPGAQASSSSSSAGPAAVDWLTTRRVWRWLDAAPAGSGRSHDVTWHAFGPTESASVVVLVHGFGASSRHWRGNVAALVDMGHRVLTVDLLGFGGSDKPGVFPGDEENLSENFEFSIELWARQLSDFAAYAATGRSVALVGNSLGSLVCLVAAAKKTGATPLRVRGLCLINTAGAMNNRGALALDDDGLPSDGLSPVTLRVAQTVFALLDWVLSKPPLARWLFDRVRRRDNVRAGEIDLGDTGLSFHILYLPSRPIHRVFLQINPSCTCCRFFLSLSPSPTLSLSLCVPAVLESVYSTRAAASSRVDDELVDLITSPADDPGAPATFAAILRGPPGPRPDKLAESGALDDVPILFLWGDADPFTPLEGGVPTFFRARCAGGAAATEARDWRFEALTGGVGHCPHDECPDLVHARLLPWLSELAT